MAVPSIENIAGVVAGAGARHIVVEAGRCVEVRHRAAQCGACMDTCPEGAITVKDNRITLQPELCLGCGSCASECPTQALRTVQPSESDLIMFVDTVADEVFGKLAESDADKEPVLEFACEHAHPSSADARIIVPALPYVDEAVLVHAAASGFDRIVLTSCNDARCMKPTLAAVPDILATVRPLLAAAGSACTISLRREKPPAQNEEDSKATRKHARKPTPRSTANGSETQVNTVTGTTTVGHREYSRRGMLSDMASQASTIVAETAAAELRDRLGQQPEQPSLRQTLTDGTGKMRKFDMPRAESLLNDLYVLNPEPTGPLNVRGFAQVEVNAQACTRCGMCMNFCTTGALEGEAAPIGSNPFGAWRPAGLQNEEPEVKGSLTFRISDCVGCHLCEVACPLRCLHVNDEVDASTIFELEPIDLLA